MSFKNLSTHREDTDGDDGGLVGEIPRMKQVKIESRKNGVDFDFGITPDTNKLQNAKRGKKEE